MPTREAILAALDLPAVIQELVGQELRGSGPERRIRCVFHDDSRPSMAVNLRTGLFICYACRAQGSIIDLTMHRLGLDTAGAFRFLEQRAGLPRSEPRPSSEELHRQNETLLRRYEVPAADNESAVRFVDESIIDAHHELLMRTESYLQRFEEKRGITPETCVRFKLGHDNQRFFIPIRDETGRAVNIRRYQLGAGVRPQDKMISWRQGFGEARLFPIENLHSDVIYLFEGELDCLLACQHGLAALTTTGGAGTWKESWTPRLQDKRVVICYDCDEAGREGAAAIARQLHRVAAEVKVINLPLSEPVGADFTDFIHEGRRSIAEFHALVDATAPFVPPEVAPNVPASAAASPEVVSRPSILVDRLLDREKADEIIATYEAEQARRPTVFRRGNKFQRPEGGGLITTVGRQELYVDLSHRVTFLKPKNDSVVPRLPTYAEADLIYFDPAVNVPKLRGVSRVPLFCGEGWTLRTMAGYDPADEWMLHLDFAPEPLPQVIGPEHVAEARRLLDVELTGDFRYETESDRTNHVALAVTSVVRNQIEGSVPLFAQDAPSNGAGKGLAVAVALMPAFGREGEGWRSVSYSGVEEERRKSITTYLLEGYGALRWDNLSEKLDSASFAKLMTDRMWTDRRLGGNAGITVPATALQVVTGVNMQFSPEMLRRVVRCRQVPDVERPEERRGFRHPDLLRWARENRPRLLWALQVLVANWVQRGQPDPSPEVPTMGSFEEWRRIVGGVLGAAGYVGFLADRDRLRAEADPDSGRWLDFVSAWFLRFGYSLRSASELLETATDADLIIQGTTDRGKATSLGGLLAGKRDAVIGAFKVLRGEGRDRRKYRLTSAPTDGGTRQGTTGGDTCDTCDTSPIPIAENEVEIGGALEGMQENRTVEAGAQVSNEGVLGSVEGVTGGTGVTELSDVPPW